MEEVMEIPKKPETPCIEWAGTKERNGYGVISFGGRQFVAHRLEWERVNGPIPEGMVIDHLCRNTSCVRPDHMEPVSGKVNTLRGVGAFAENARKTKCKRGHELTPQRRNPAWRECRICQRIFQDKYRKENAEEIRKKDRENAKKRRERKRNEKSQVG